MRTPEQIAQDVAGTAYVAGRTLSEHTRRIAYDAAVAAAREAQREAQEEGRAEQGPDAMSKTSNRYSFTAEFDSEVWETLNGEERSEWIDRVRAAIADEAHVAEERWAIPESKFAPEGEPDEYRDAFESLSDTEHGPNWIGRRVADLTPFDETHETARHILVFLSEKARRAKQAGDVY